MKKKETEHLPNDLHISFNTPCKSYAHWTSKTFLNPVNLKTSSKLNNILKGFDFPAQQSVVQNSD